MEQHMIPRQITTFEFKLVGFMTLKQFIYLVVFLPIAYIVVRLFPIPVLNILLGAVIAGFGIALAFFPVNDRPLDVFLKNLYKRMTSPTQYAYFKNNEPLSFLSELGQMTEPQKALHADSKKKLLDYLQHKQKAVVPPTAPTVPDQRKQALASAMHSLKKEDKKDGAVPVQAPQSAPQATDKVKPFMVGVVKNNKQMPLPGVLLYIKDEKNMPLRLLKTNPHGVFATYSSLPPGQYQVEIKDPKDTFFFDTMKIQLDKNNPRPLEFYSRELL